MSKPLQSGQWCKPRNEQEWKAVLDLAESLGMWNEKDCVPHEMFPAVFMSSDGSICACVNRHEPTPIPVPDFIAGMYATTKETNIAPSDTEADLRRRLKFMEDTIASLEVPKLTDLEERVTRLEKFPLIDHLSVIGENNTLAIGKSLADRLLPILGPTERRLSKLEAAFNEHLVKERETNTTNN